MDKLNQIHEQTKQDTAKQMLDDWFTEHSEKQSLISVFDKMKQILQKPDTSQTTNIEKQID